MQREKPKLFIPKDSWEPSYFGSPNNRQTIRGRAKLSRLSNLREIVLPPGDIEVRLWEGFGITYLQGYVLKRMAGAWTAVQLLPAVPRNSANNYTKTLPAPRSGWEAFWNKLLKEDLLTLPDMSTLKPDGIFVTDGFSYVVEMNFSKTYRTYMYDNPQHRKWPEAQRILAIAHLFRKEFGLI